MIEIIRKLILCAGYTNKSYAYGKIPILNSVIEKYYFQKYTSLANNSILYKQITFHCFIKTIFFFFHISVNSVQSKLTHKGCPALEGSQAFNLHQFPPDLRSAVHSLHVDSSCWSLSLLVFVCSSAL